MDSNWRSLGLAMAAACVLLFTAGCGGFSADQPVSPATFLLPGLGKVAPSKGGLKHGVVTPAQPAPLVAVSR